MKTNISKIYKEDQQDRRAANPKNFKEIAKRDALRRGEVLGLLKNGEIVTGKEFYLASIIFQHGDKPSDYRKAIKLAREATERGYKKGRYLEALATDRLLVTSGKKQKFGTQFFQKNSRSKYVLFPVDPKTTDEDRGKYGLPPLAKLISEVNLLNKDK
jgi:hypothetical protein